MIQKEMFDASIHVGQFSLCEQIRIACKNQQVQLLSKSVFALSPLLSALQRERAADLIDALGVVTLVQNSVTDDLLWNIPSRKAQDVFYSWMDVFHSVKNIQKTPDDSLEQLTLAVKLAHTYIISGQAASIIAGAIVSGCSRIVTLYQELLQTSLVETIENDYKIAIRPPTIGDELSYQEIQIQEEDGKVFHLEELYQLVMNFYRDNHIDLLKKLPGVVSLKNIVAT